MFLIFGDTVSKTPDVDWLGEKGLSMIMLCFDDERAPSSELGSHLRTIKSRTRLYNHTASPKPSKSVYT